VSKLTVGDLIDYAMSAQRLCGADYGYCRESYGRDRRLIMKGQACGCEGLRYVLVL
jgi:hypothetical protein